MLKLYEYQERAKSRAQIGDVLVGVVKVATRIKKYKNMTLFEYYF